MYSYIMLFILGPAFGFVLSGAKLRTLDITVLYKRCTAHLYGFVESDCFIFNETTLPVVLLALLLLLGLVLGDIGGVAPPVVGVVALDNIVVLGLFDHLDLVDTPLAVSTRSGGCNGREAHISVVSLTLGTSLELDRWVASIVVTLMVALVVTMMGISTLI